MSMPKCQFYEFVNDIMGKLLRGGVSTKGAESTTVRFHTTCLIKFHKMHNPADNEVVFLNKDLYCIVINNIDLRQLNIQLPPSGNISV